MGLECGILASGGTRFNLQFFHFTKQYTAFYRFSTGYPIFMSNIGIFFFLAIFPSLKNLTHTLANLLKFSQPYSDLEKIMREEAKDDHTCLNKIDH